MNAGLLRKAQYGLALVLMALCAGCTAPKEYEWNIPDGYPLPSIPETNPMTPAKVLLGRHLFHDTRLSRNGTQACASCHMPEFAFTEPRAKAVGSTGELNRRNTLALVNVAYNDTLMWAHPGLFEIERQMLIPMFGENPVELGHCTGHEGRGAGPICRRTRSIKGFFEEAFPHDPGPIGIQADESTRIACFVRALVSFDSPFDRYAYGGQDDAMTESAIRGLNHFFSERFECHHCHGGFNFTQSSTHQSIALLENPFHNTGPLQPRREEHLSRSRSRLV